MEDNFSELRSFLRNEEKPQVCENEKNKDIVWLNGEKGFADGSAEFIRISKNFQIVIGEAKFSDDFLMKFKGEDWVKFFYVRSGKVSIRLAEGKNPFEFLAFTGFFHYCPFGDYYFEEISGENAATWTCIMFKKDFFLKKFFSLKNLKDAWGCFLDPLGLSKQTIFSMPSPPHAISILRELNNLTKPNDWRLTFVKSKALELITLQLAEFERRTDRGRALETKLPSQTVEKLAAIKTSIESGKYLSLKAYEIARMNGMSEITLNRGFKAAYGITMRKFLYSKKMEFAKNFLVENQGALKELTFLLGYKRESSLSVAIKNYFGVNARDLKKLNQI